MRRSGFDEGALKAVLLAYREERTQLPAGDAVAMPLLGLLGEVLLSNGHHQLARQVLTSAEEIADSIDDPEIMQLKAQIKLTLAITYFHSDQPEKAMRFADTVLTYPRLEPRHRAKALAVRGRSLEDTGAYAEAAAAYRSADQELEEFGDPEAIAVRLIYIMLEAEIAPLADLDDQALAAERRRAELLRKHEGPSTRTIAQYSILLSSLDVMDRHDEAVVVGWEAILLALHAASPDQEKVVEFLRGQAERLVGIGEAEASDHLLQRVALIHNSPEPVLEDDAADSPPVRQDPYADVDLEQILEDLAVADPLFAVGTDSQDDSTVDPRSDLEDEARQAVRDGDLELASEVIEECLTVYREKFYDEGVARLADLLARAYVNAARDYMDEDDEPLGAALLLDGIEKFEEKQLCDTLGYAKIAHQAATKLAEIDRTEEATELFARAFKNVKGGSEAAIKLLSGSVDFRHGVFERGAHLSAQEIDVERVKSLASIGDLVQARALFDRLDPSHRDLAVRSLVKALADAGEVADATSLTVRSASRMTRSMLLFDLVRWVAESGNFGAIRHVLEHTPSLSVRTRHAFYAAEVLAQNGDVANARTLLDVPLLMKSVQPEEASDQRFGGSSLFHLRSVVRLCLAVGDSNSATLLLPTVIAAHLRAEDENVSGECGELIALIHGVSQALRYLSELPGVPEVDALAGWLGQSVRHSSDPEDFKKAAEILSRRLPVDNPASASVAQAKFGKAALNDANTVEVHDYAQTISDPEQRSELLRATAAAHKSDSNAREIESADTSAALVAAHRAARQYEDLVAEFFPEAAEAAGHATSARRIGDSVETSSIVDSEETRQAWETEVQATLASEPSYRRSSALVAFGEAALGLKRPVDAVALAKRAIAELPDSEGLGPRFVFVDAAAILRQAGASTEIDQMIVHLLDSGALRGTPPPDEITDYIEALADEGLSEATPRLLERLGELQTSAAAEEQIYSADCATILNFVSALPEERLDRWERDLQSLGELCLNWRRYDLALEFFQLLNRVEQRARQERETVLNVDLTEGERGMYEAFMHSGRYDEALRVLSSYSSPYYYFFLTDEIDLDTIPSGSEQAFGAVVRQAYLEEVARAAKSLSELSDLNETRRDTNNVGATAAYLDLLRLVSLNVRESAIPRAMDEVFEVIQGFQVSRLSKIASAMASRQNLRDPELGEDLKRLEHSGTERVKLNARLAAMIAQEESPARMASILEELQRLEKYKNEVLIRIQRMPPTERLASAATPAPLATAQALLLKDEVIIQYCFDVESPFALVTRRDRVEMVSIPLDQEYLRSLSAQLRRTLNVAGAVASADFLNGDWTAAHELYRRLIAPLDHMIRQGDILIVVSANEIDLLPFAALLKTPLPTESLTLADLRNAHWLASTNPVVAVPSIRAWANFRGATQRTRAPEPFIGFGDPVLQDTLTQAVVYKAQDLWVSLKNAFRGEEIANIEDVRRLPSLPETGTELNNLARVLNAPESSVFTRGRATEFELKHHDLARYRIIAFSTHAVRYKNDEGTTLCALVLTPPAAATTEDDGLLTPSEIGALRLNADWVFLTACETAHLASASDNDGFATLVQSFIFAGGHSLYVSQWPVASSATVALTTQFFEYMAGDGMRPPFAHQKAMLSLKDDSDNPIYAHPFFWAPFVLFGDCR